MFKNLSAGAIGIRSASLPETIELARAGGSEDRRDEDRHRGQGHHADLRAYTDGGEALHLVPQAAGQEGCDVGGLPGGEIAAQDERGLGVVDHGPHIGHRGTDVLKVCA